MVHHFHRYVCIIQLHSTYMYDDIMNRIHEAVAFPIFPSQVGGPLRLEAEENNHPHARVVIP